MRWRQQMPAWQAVTSLPDHHSRETCQRNPSKRNQIIDVHVHADATSICKNDGQTSFSIHLHGRNLPVFSVAAPQPLWEEPRRCEATHLRRKWARPEHWNDSWLITINIYESMNYYTTQQKLRETKNQKINLQNATERPWHTLTQSPLHPGSCARLNIHRHQRVAIAGQLQC